jgi:Cu/Ag efflux pump CusA
VVAARSVVALVARARNRDETSDASTPVITIRSAASERLVPVLITGVATALAVLPFVVAGNEPGLEIVHPLAIAVLGGIVTSMLVTLILTPVVYARFMPEEDAGAQQV